MEPAIPVDHPSPAVEVAAAATVLFDQLSPFSRVIVVDVGPMRMMRFGSANGDDQSGYRLNAPHELAFEYARVVAHLVALVPGHHRRSPRWMLIGVGGGSLLTHWARHHPLARVDAIEVDAVVIAAAKRHFPLPQSPRIQVRIADGAAYVASTDHRYDAIVLDAFGAGGIPDALATPSFYAHVASRLRPNGVVIANIALVDGQPREMIVDRIVQAFGSCVVLEGKADENWVIIAGRTVTTDQVGNTLEQASPGLPLGIGGDVTVVRSCVRDP